MLLPCRTKCNVIWFGLNSTNQPVDLSTGLRLPNITLPEFTGKEDLDRFLEQFTNVLQASGADFRHHFTYFKQECRKHAQAFHFLCIWEQEHFPKLQRAPSKLILKSIFEMVLTPCKHTKEFRRISKYGIYLPHTTRCSNNQKKGYLICTSLFGNPAFTGTINPWNR